MKIKGSVDVVSIVGGKVTSERRFENLIVDAGLNHLRDGLLHAVPGTSFAGWCPTHMMFGTGTTPTTSTDTDLESPLANSGVEITRFFRSGQKVILQCFLAENHESTQDEDITEIGLFNSPDGSNIMFSRVVVTEVSKSAKIQLVIIWSIDFSG